MKKDRKELKIKLSNGGKLETVGINARGLYRSYFRIKNANGEYYGSFDNTNQIKALKAACEKILRYK